MNLRHTRRLSRLFASLLLDKVLPATGLLLLLATPVSAQMPEPILGEPPQLTVDIEPRAATSATEPRDAAATGSWIDVSNRETVRLSYNNLVAAISNVPVGWTGNINTGDAGATSDAYRNAVLTNMNWYRSMAGVPPVTWEASLFSEEQQAALMMSANRQLSHTPPTSWLFYTAAGARAAGRSNIALGYNTATDPGAISLYMVDFGTNNTAAGHRRWILFPQTLSSSTGDVPATSGFQAANALLAFGTPTAPSRPVTRETYVAWPPNGYIPYQILPNRWSFSVASADFSNATITATRNGTNLAVATETIANGYGENTIVFALGGVSLSGVPTPQRPSVDTSTTVNINGVRVGGQTRDYTYVVTVFDPAAAGPVGGPPSVPVSGIVHGATLQAGAIAPNGFGSIFGTNLAVATRSWDLAFQNGVAPTDLDGTRVLVNNKPAYIAFTSRGADFGVSYDQINFLVPDSTATGSVEVVVSSPTGRSDPVLITQMRRSPAFFPFEPRGRRYVAALENDGRYFVGPSDLFGGPVGGRPVRGAAVNDNVAIYGTAFGDTNPPVPTGQLPTGVSQLTSAVRVFVGPAEAQVLFAGLSGFAGVYQIVIRVPNLPAGEYAINAEIAGQRTPDGVVLTIAP